MKIAWICCVSVLMMNALADRYYTDEAAVTLPEDRLRHVEARLGDGSVAIIGGFGVGTKNIVFLINGDATKVDAVSSTSIHFGGYDIGGIALPNGNALIVKGGHGGVYDYKTKKFHQTENALSPDYIRWPTLTALSSGMILVSGGDTDDFKALSYWAVYDPDQNKFITFGEMQQPRSRHSATELKDGRILIAGGRQSTENDGVYNSAEILDLSTGRSSLLSSKMAMARAGHGAVLLDSGRVLLVSGKEWSGGSDSCELFNPASMTFRSTASLGRPRCSPVLWKCGGDVLVVGGGDDFRVVEVFNEEQERFSINPDLLQYPRSSGFTLTPLHEKTALIVGGRVNSGERWLNRIETLTACNALEKKVQRLPTKSSSDQKVGALVRVYQDGILRRELPIADCSVKEKYEDAYRSRDAICEYLTNGVVDCVSPRLEVAFSPDCTYEERVNLLHTIGYCDIPKIRLGDDISRMEASKWNAVDPNSLLPPKKEADAARAATLPIKLRYSVSGYDSARDPSEDLKAAMQIASQADRRILLLVGGTWNEECRKLEDFFEENAEIGALLSARYVIMKVSLTPTNRNQEFLSRFTGIKAVPHLLVLDENGQLMSSLNTEGFACDGSYDVKKLLAVLGKLASGETP